MANVAPANQIQCVVVQRAVGGEQLAHREPVDAGTVVDHLFAGQLAFVVGRQIGHEDLAEVGGGDGVAQGQDADDVLLGDGMVVIDSRQDRDGLDALAL